ncbi:MAG: hypothetical protein HYX85_02585 [Chloroflexi bacterium]|nr:hypothetical protein [Chloroflexota bacterium]
MALVELLVAIAITGLIISLPGTAIYQFFAVTESGSRTLTALHDVQNAASWFALDGQMAATANVSSDELKLTLSDNSTIEYELEGSGPLYELRREAGSSEIVISRNVSAAVFSVDGRVITMTITSSPVNRWGISETRTYKVYLRPTS